MVFSARPPLAAPGLGPPLPERLRRIVLWRAEGLTVLEIAARVGLSQARVQQLLQRARRLACAGRGG